MLIIINDDSAYLSWISRHRHGFVVDCKRKLEKNHLTMHRANCLRIKPHKRARLTTGARIKICALEVMELEAWAQAETDGGLIACPDCRPDHPESESDAHRAKHALTRLGNDIVSYVVDVAVMFLDEEESCFRPTVESAAKYLDKSPAQIAAAIDRLREEHYLVCDGTAADGALQNNSILYPMAEALRSVPAFDAMSDEELCAELDRLRKGH